GNRMSNGEKLIDFTNWRGHAIGRRSIELRERSSAQQRSSAAARRRAQISRLKANLTVQYAAALCRASDEQRVRWGWLAEVERPPHTEPRDELLAQRVRARLRARGIRPARSPGESSETTPRR